MASPYAHRTDAGRRLADALRSYAGRRDLIVLALPRGGVPVAAVVADALHAPLDVLIVRKLGFPGQPELAMGAIASGGSGGVTVLNEPLIASAAVPRAIVDETIEHEQRELNRRQRLYRGARAHPDLRGRCVIVIDDGLATGSTMLAAVQALRKLDPAWLVVAVPVAPPDAVHMLRPHADDVVCPLTPVHFSGVGQWYDDFTQTSDDEVRRLLDNAWTRQPVGGHPA